MSFASGSRLGRSLIRRLPRLNWSLVTGALRTWRDFHNFNGWQDVQDGTGPAMYIRCRGGDLAGALDATCLTRQYLGASTWSIQHDIHDF